MQIKANGLMKVLLPVFVIVVAFIGVKTCSTSSEPVPAAENKKVLAELSQDDLKALGIEGDTPEDTLRTLVGALREVRTRQNALEKQNVTLVEENEALKEKNTSVDAQIARAVNSVRQDTSDALEQQKQGLISQFQSLTSQLSSTSTPSSGGQNAGNTASTGSDMPIGLGLDGAGSSESAGDGLIWVNPADAQPAGKNGQQDDKSFTFPTSFLDSNPVSAQRADYERVAKNQQELTGSADASPAEPVYTLPENATLVGSRAMTALMGRVPVNDKVTDPYPFKILIGKDNLTANGIELPDVEGAIVSGTAAGDWTLSCVRGSVTSITFVFADGTVRTVPKPSGNTDGSNQTAAGNGGSIGWISDDNGIPCISGERKSNASTYLPTIALLGMGSGAGDALTQNQYTAQNNGTDVMSTLTGNAGQAVLGQSLGGGFKEVTEWVKQRYGQTFDAVYVPPGATVAVHVTRQLAIDYEEKGRQVKYDFSLPGDAHQRSLD